MTLNSAGVHRRPALRQLACALLLAMAALPALSLRAANLEGDSADVGFADLPEKWWLSNGAHLNVLGGGVWGLDVSNSSVTLDNARVARNSGFDTVSVALQGGSLLDAANSHISDGGVRIQGTSSMYLHDSSITIDEHAPGFAGLNTIGILAVLSGDVEVLLRGSRIAVADNPERDHLNSGVGIRQGSGRFTLRNGSRIDAANVGVILHGTRPLDHAIALTIDNSHVQGGRGAALQVVTGTDGVNTYDILVTDGSVLEGGDGHLLQVGGMASSAQGHADVAFTVSDSRLYGDIAFDRATASGTLNVTLRNLAEVRGRFHDVSQATIDTGSRWQLTGDSRVGHLHLNDSGTVALGNGQQFHTLSLDTFTGTGGTWVFNTVLGDDGSATDRVVIGGDATGHAGVFVRNVGGQGAQTVNGIALITIGGQSDATFSLLNRVTGGLYEYFLVKGADGHWYLRSEREPEPPHECIAQPALPHCEVTLPVEPIDPIEPIDPTDPEEPIDPGDPVDPGTPTPVLRPETGAYLANQAATRQLLEHGARERMNAAEAVEGTRTWAATRYSDGRMDVIGQQQLRFTQSRLQVGTHLGAFDQDQGRLGMLLTAGQAEATSRSRVTGYRADARVQGGAVGAYVNWSNEGLYLDASVQHGRFNNRVQGQGLDAERYDTRLWQSALEAGSRFNAGTLGGMLLRLEPQLQLTHTVGSMDTHVESNGTVVTQASGNGLSTRVGLRLEGDALIGNTRVAPYVALSGYHADRNAALSFDGEVIYGGMPRTRAALNVGGQLSFGNRLGGFGDVSASRGEDGYQRFDMRIGLSYRW
jgi:autotransporter family porin